ncbi:MAG TPA: bifunctional DNA primase/polymerase [Oculatellaceae cyanobacterium]
MSAIAGHEPSIYGLRWGGQTRFAVLDVDKNSKYRSDLELAKLQERLAAVGLTATVYRSSDSGGWHLYIFFDEWADSGDTNQLLSTWLKAQGYEIRGGER